MSNIKSVRTAKGVSIFLKGQSPVSIDVGAGNYEAVIEALDAGDLTKLTAALNVRQYVVEQSFGKFSVDSHGNLVYTPANYVLPAELTEYVLPILKKARNVEPILLYVEHLLSNPSQFAQKELLQWVDKAKMPITPDGHFLAYKRVRSDYKDVHSGTMDNSVGQVVQMPRLAVDDDRTRTCSAGLHFCSKDYLSHFGGDRIVVVKINPADVVSIPDDYDFTKGRAWRYEVVAELSTLDGELIRELDGFFIDEYDSRDEVVVELKQVSKNAQGTVSLTKVVAPKADSVIGKTSLTDDQVRRVRKLLKQGGTVAGVARTIGTSERTVARIRDGETYTNVR